MVGHEPYRQIVHLSPDAIMIHSAGRIVYANPAAASLLGAESAEAVIGMRALDIVHPDFRDTVLQRMADEEAGRPAPTMEEKFVRLDGTLVDVEVAGMPFVHEGKPAGQIVARDITNRKRTEAQLLEAEQRYRALVENLPAASYIEVVDETAATLYISPQVEEILGLSQEDFIADPEYWVNHLHPDDRQRSIEDFQRFVDTGEPSVLEYRMVTEDGRVVWCHDMQVILRDELGEPALIQGVMFDVTEQKLAEEALSRRDAIMQAVDYAAQSLLRASGWREAIDDVLRSLGEATDASTVTVWETYEATSDKPLRSSLTFEWVAPGAPIRIDNPAHTDFPLDESWREWTQDMRAGRAIFGLARERPAGERYFYEETGMVSVLDVPVFVDGEWWGIIGFEDSRERDFSIGEVEALKAAAGTIGAAVSRERTEQQLRDTEQKYRALVEQIPAVIYIDTPTNDEHTIYISPQIEEILGLSADEWMRDPRLWYRHLHPEDQQYALLSYRRGVSSGKPFSYEYRMLTPRGLVWIRDDAVVLKGDDGLPLVQGVMFDVTEQKLAEEALLESESREREAAQQLRALDQMKNTFLAAVSHELRSPLTSVLGLALTLEQQQLTREEQNDLLKRLSSNARKLQRLLSDLLDIDRLSRNVITPQLHTTDVGALVRGTVQAADFLGDRTLKVEADSVIATVDGAKVERIVENLLVNTARHTPEETTVWVRVNPYESGVLITVEDDGPGIPQDMHDSIFEPFRQGPTHASHTPGTGIGLTLVQRFADLHGGRVWIDDREGGGASFKVYLPSTGETPVST